MRIPRNHVLYRRMDRDYGILVKLCYSISVICRYLDINSDMESFNICVIEHYEKGKKCIQGWS